jgi:KUP system potassium uptake protein
MRADNRGEGGILALMALAQRVTVGNTVKSAISLIGVAGACLFFGDGVITPAISVLSAVEGGWRCPRPAWRYSGRPWSTSASARPA